jgi:hypothetical protein
MGGACGTYGGEERFIQGFGGETEGKEPLGGPRYRWVDSIKTYLQEVSWGGMDWICLTENMARWCADVDAVMKVRVP